VAIVARSKLPWRRKCVPLYYMDPTIEGIIPFVEQYRKSGVFDFLGRCFR